MASSMAKEAENASTVDSNKVCSNGRSREDKYGDGILSIEGRGCSMKPICYGCE